MSKQELKSDYRILRKTASICHFCLKEDGKVQQVPAEVIDKDGKAVLRKHCKKHGEFEEVYWSSTNFYEKFIKWFVTGKGVNNPTFNKSACPTTCGLCKNHHSNTLLANLDITNRCNLACWYCFANAASQGYIFEPSFQECKEMIKFLRDQQPAPVEAIQFSGGEPTVRLDLPEIAAEAYRRGFNQIQLATNGILIGQDYDLTEELVEGGINTIYMKFNGVTRQTNPENWHLIDKIFNNLRRAGITENRHGGVVLVNFQMKGHNTHETYDVIKFAQKNLDIVRGTIVQPISFVGRFADPNAKPLPEEERLTQRLTLPEYLDNMEDQSNGKLTPDDFRPIPVVLPISHLLEVLQGKDLIEFTSHPMCGIATYLFEVDGEMVPITRFFDVDKMMEGMEFYAQQIKNGEIKPGKAITGLLKLLEDTVDKEKAPTKFNVQKLMFDIIQKGSFEALADFHYRSLLVTGMHFQDPYNFDLERVKRCVIHFVMPKGKLAQPRLVPFCSYNTLPMYRRSLEHEFGMSIEDWKKDHPGKEIYERA